MRQALPSRQDLDDVRRTRINGNDRVMAGYEVLMEHYRRAIEACRTALASGRSAPRHQLVRRREGRTTGRYLPKRGPGMRNMKL